MKKYFPCKVYSMKCRLYPNKKQKEYIENCFHGLRAISNMINYDMRNRFLWTKEKEDKATGDRVHWADFNKAFSAESLNYYRSQNKFIDYVPGGALSSSKFGLAHDFKLSASTPKNVPVERWGEKYLDKATGEKRCRGAKIYGKSCMPTSYSYPTSISNLKVYEDRKNVIGIKLRSSKHEAEYYVKIRGWNKNIRFDNEYKIGFVEWVQHTDSKSTIQIRISKDNCGDYYIIFLLNDVYIPQDIPETRRDVVGIDVGEISLASLSNNKKYQNLKSYNPKVIKERRLASHYEKILSRGEGWKNIKWRENAKRDENIKPSDTYNRKCLKLAKIKRKIIRQRKHYYNVVSKEICVENNVIGIEGLSIKDMFYNKKNEGKTNKQKHFHNRNLQEASLHDFLQMIKYKGLLYAERVVEIGQYEATTILCSNCCHKIKKLPVMKRNWVCPCCGKKHDRDYNAAYNIEQKARKILGEEKTE